MKKYIIKIELLSDLCVSNGGVYNSYLDTDICYDKYGFPFIPAKRLKGCFKESAYELVDWKWGNKEDCDSLFGKEGDDNSKFRLSDARVEDYLKNREAVKKCANNIIAHPQSILKYYTYIRSETSIDYKTGIAEEHSLRNMRVVSRGNNFFAIVEVEEQYADILKSAIETTTNIGLARTRGFGEVRITLGEEIVENSCNNSQSNIDDETKCLKYHLTTLQPVILKSIYGEESTMDYFDGSKILGLIITRLKEEKKDVKQFLDSGELFCSNAYIEKDGKRSSEVSASYFTKKNDKSKYFDKCFFSKEKYKNIQISKMGHCYVLHDNDKLQKIDINKEQRYHHTRPEDKSIGRSIESDGENSAFFQLESISEEQVFQGYITGSKEQIKTIYELLNSKKDCYIGNYKSAEYGHCLIEIEPMILNNSIVTNKFMVKLESPTIIYNDKAMYSVDVDDLSKEIIERLQLPKGAKLVKKFINYATIGGYNVSWKLRKPYVRAFDKGTVLYYELDNKQCLSTAFNYLGERISEGNGEFSVIEYNNSFTNEHEITNYFNADKNYELIDLDYNKILIEIANRLFENYVESKAVELAKDSNLVESIDKGTISKMIGVHEAKQNSRKLKDVEEEVAKIYKDKKTPENEERKKQLDNIINKVKEGCKDIGIKFNKEYFIKSYKYKDDEGYLYLGFFLRELKYRKRDSKDKRGK